MKIREVWPEITDLKTRAAVEEMARTANSREEEYVDVEFPAADTEVAVDLTNFTDVPANAEPALPSSNVRFYRGDSEWTPKRAYLKCDTAGIAARFKFSREDR